MSVLRAQSRRFAPGVIAVALIAVLFAVARYPTASASQAEKIASQYKFTQMSIAMPPGYHQTEDIRPVNPAYQHIQAWLSSIGSSVDLTDLTGKGRDDDMCVVDPRTNDVIATYAPTAPASDQFTPFVLNPAPLPMDKAMAPISCTAGDFNGDGRMDLLVDYFGRTPIIYLARSGATQLSASAYKPVELVPSASPDGQYHGPRWQSVAVNVADYDGTGHPDIFVGNYFPDSDVLDPNGLDNVQMNSSMSNARNAGGDHIFRWVNAQSGPNPAVSYAEVPAAIPYDASTGWTLAVASADLTGNGLPDLYVANDFGPDHLLYNVSTPGNIRFKTAVGQRTPTTPKSFVVGKDSFKGMGVDFGDMSRNGRFDMMVSNITTAYGLEESNLAYMNDATSNGQMQHDLASGVAPFTQRAAQMGLAWSGWSWDLKMGDFLNNGNLEVVQTDGFVRGNINRWPWVQELAMANDDLYTSPAMWPNIKLGDDLGGHQPVAFYAKGPDGGYANISKQLGMAGNTYPSRGIATADTRGTGALDFAVARQWAAPDFFANESPARGNYLGLHLYRPAAAGSPSGGLQATGSPAYGATARITTADGHTQVSQLDGGSGNTGKRSFEVNFGLGSSAGPVTVNLQWRDTGGQLHQQALHLTPGTHNLLLTSTAEEVPSK